MISIAKKELYQFFSSLTGYITIILFLLVNALYLFVLKDSNIFDYGYATLNSFFDLAPWVFIFLIPALGMRSFADEFKSGTFETLKTSPLTKWQIVFGKYISDHCCNRYCFNSDSSLCNHDSIFILNRRN